MSVLALVLSAIAVGLDNFAVAVSLGVSDVARRERLRIVGVFALFETAAPVVGIAIGQPAARHLGHAGRYVGGGLLIAIGIWVLVSAATSKPRSPGSRRGRLLLTAAALSFDNLVIGFGLGVTRVSLPASVIVFVSVSVVLSLLGLEIGRRVARVVGTRDDLFAGAMLAAVGVLVATGVL